MNSRDIIMFEKAGDVNLLGGATGEHIVIWTFILHMHACEYEHGNKICGRGITIPVSPSLDRLISLVELWRRMYNGLDKH